MKIINYFLKVVALNKKEGKDLKKLDKTNFSNSELKLQIEIGTIILDNVRKISINMLILCTFIFFISILSSIFYYFITKNQDVTIIILLLASSILTFISGFYWLFMDKMSIIKSGVHAAERQLGLNYKFEQE